MASFVNYVRSTHLIEREIARMGVALGVDWSDELQVRALAREALEKAPQKLERLLAQPTDRRLMAKASRPEFLVATLGAAKLGVESKGGPTWKAFGRALWAENELLKNAPPPNTPPPGTGRR